MGLALYDNIDYGEAIDNIRDLRSNNAVGIEL